MGYWYETCNLSNLTITSGKQGDNLARMMVVSASDYKINTERACYPFDGWNIELPPIKVAIGGSGWEVEILDQEGKDAFDLMTKGFLYFKDTEEFKTIRESLDEKDLESVDSWIEFIKRSSEGINCCKARTKGLRPMYLYFIREDVWQALVEPKLSIVEKDIQYEMSRFDELEKEEPVVTCLMIAHHLYYTWYFTTQSKKDLMALNITLSQLRKSIQTTCGTGSHSTNYKEYLEYCKIISKICKEEIKIERSEKY